MHAQFRKIRTVLLCASACMTLMCAACNVSVLTLPLAPPPDPFSGHAALVWAQIGDAFVSSGDSGFLPPGGGKLESSVIEVAVPNLLTAEVIHSSVIGQGQEVHAETSLANLDLQISGHRITSEFVATRAAAVCDNGAPVSFGSVVYSNVVIDGQAHTVTADPNTTHPLTDLNGNRIGQITFNEQLRSIGADTNAITITAMHVVITGVADIAVGRAHAGIRCAAPTPIEDIVTGGGFITTAAGKATFGLMAGNRNGLLGVHLVFKDHGADERVKATSITSYDILDPLTRRFAGTCEVNHVPGFTYEVTVADLGEPGTNDTFALTVSDGYTASGTVGGGNIQLHN